MGILHIGENNKVVSIITVFLKRSFIKIKWLVHINPVVCGRNLLKVVLNVSTSWYLCLCVMFLLECGLAQMPCFCEDMTEMMDIIFIFILQENVTYILLDSFHYFLELHSLMKQAAMLKRFM